MSHYAFIRYVVGRRRQLFCSTFETWATIDPIEIKEEGVSRTFSENQISYESKEDWRTDDPKNKFSPLSLDSIKSCFWCLNTTFRGWPFFSIAFGRQCIFRPTCSNLSLSNTFFVPMLAHSIRYELFLLA